MGVDLRIAARRLGRQPLSSLAIVLCLSFALGLNSAAFSFVDGVLLRPFPYPDSEQLYVVWGAADLETRRGVSGHRVDQWQQIAGVDGVSVFSFTPLRIAIDAEDTRTELQIGLIGADTFSLLGISPLLGRNIDGRDVDARAENVVVISHALWLSAFGGEESALGRAVVIDGRPHEVVGVMPESFFFPDYWFDAWIPLRRDSAIFDQVQAVLRLRSGADARQVQAEMTAIRFDDVAPVGTSSTLGMFPMRQLVVPEHRRATWTLWAITATLLGMACIGASSWFVSRIVTRSRELATRVSLGGDSARLVREVVAEPSLVVGLAAILAIGWAHLALRMLAWIAPSLSRVSTAELDPWAIAYMGFVAIIFCVLSSLAPLVAARAIDPATLLSDAWSTSRRTAVRWQRVFLGAQVASATAMCVAAVLLVQSFVTLNQLNLGFDPQGVLVATLNVPRDLRASAAAHEAAIATVLKQLKALPAVHAATSSYGVPLRWDRWDQTVVSTDDRLASAGIWTVGDDYFATLRIPVLRGQQWTKKTAASSRTVVVNGTFARALWGTLDVIGQRFQTLKPTAALRKRLRHDPSLVRDTSLMRARSSYELDAEWTVIGVVADVRMFGLEDSTGPAIYMRSRDRNNSGSARQSLVIRTESSQTLNPAVVTQIVEQSAEVYVKEMYRLDELVRESIVGRGATPLLTVIATLMGTIALVVAGTGVFGIASTAASQRRREVSVRRALGAGNLQLLAALCRTELLTICLGLLLGLGLGLLGTQLAAVIFADAGGPPGLAYIVASLLIACVSVVGLFVPFMRALRAPIMDDLKT